jgi:hypothetical protein
VRFHADLSEDFILPACNQGVAVLRENLLSDGLLPISDLGATNDEGGNTAGVGEVIVRSRFRAASRIV